LVDGYLLRVRHRAILPHFWSFISPEKNRSPHHQGLATDPIKYLQLPKIKIWELLNLSASHSRN